MAVIDKFGRKPMLLIGSLVMWISMVLAGILVAKFRHDWASHAEVGWVVVTFIWIYVGAFGASGHRVRTV
jgi:MFS family permease